MGIPKNSYGGIINILGGRAQFEHQPGMERYRLSEACRSRLEMFLQERDGQISSIELLRAIRPEKTSLASGVIGGLEVLLPVDGFFPEGFCHISNLRELSKLPREPQPHDYFTEEQLTQDTRMMVQGTRYPHVHLTLTNDRWQPDKFSVEGTTLRTYSGNPLMRSIHITYRVDASLTPTDAHPLHIHQLDTKVQIVWATHHMGTEHSYGFTVTYDPKRERHMTFIPDVWLNMRSDADERELGRAEPTGFNNTQYLREFVQLFPSLDPREEYDQLSKHVKQLALMHRGVFKRQLHRLRKEDFKFGPPGFLAEEKGFWSRLSDKLK